MGYQEDLKVAVWNVMCISYKQSEVEKLKNTKIDTLSTSETKKKLKVSEELTGTWYFTVD